jgi:hypothetical protein
MMDLVSWLNNFCEKRDTEIGFAVTCPSTYKIFSKTRTPIFLEDLWCRCGNLVVEHITASPISFLSSHKS